MVSNTYRGVFLFWFSSPCVHYVAGFSELCIFCCPYGVLWCLFTIHEFLFICFCFCDIYLKNIIIASRSWSYGSWIYNCLCHQCLSPLTLWVRIPFRRGVLDAKLWYKIVSLWYSPGTTVSSTWPPRYNWNIVESGAITLTQMHINSGKKPILS